MEPLLCETGDQLSSVETELVLLTLRRFDELIAPTLTAACCELKLLLNALKSQRRIATTGNSLASAAVAQVSLQPTVTMLSISKSGFDMHILNPPHHFSSFRLHCPSVDRIWDAFIWCLTTVVRSVSCCVMSSHLCTVNSFHRWMFSFGFLCHVPRFCIICVSLHFYIFLCLFFWLC